MKLIPDKALEDVPSRIYDGKISIPGSYRKMLGLIPIKWKKGQKILGNEHEYVAIWNVSEDRKRVLIEFIKKRGIEEGESKEELIKPKED